MRFNAMALAAGLVVSLSTTAFAKVESLEGVSLGEHWYGPKISEADLRGRVVMLEQWGFN